MTDRKLMQQALTCLEGWENMLDEDCGDPQCDECKPFRNTRNTITALRERLAQPETVMAEYKFQTYAAYKTDGEMMIGVVPDDAPRREWVGLTDEEKLHLEIMGGKSDVMLAEVIEAKLKEKNT